MALPAFTFDTHKLVRKLRGAGFNDQQAEALTDAVQESQAALNGATKQDVVDVGRDMEQGFADVRREIGDLRRDLADAEKRTDAKLDKLGAELRHEISDLHKDNESLRKDMDAKFAAMEERSDVKHESLRKDMDAKHESLRKDNELLRKDMDAKHESLRKDMELMAARFEKRLLVWGVTLASITLFGKDTLSVLLRLFH